MSRIRTGQGKIEYFAHKGEIEKLLSEGYTIMLVYEKMHKERKISMSYKTLCYLLGNNTRKRSPKKEKITPALPTSTSEAQTDIAVRKETENTPKEGKEEDPKMLRQQQTGFKVEEADPKKLF